MKILQVCSASEMGGGEVHVADLTRALAERGHAIYLAVRPDSPLRAPLAGVIASWHEMPLRNSLDLPSIRAITELIQQHNIQLVHAHMGRDYLVAAIACRKAARAKLVLTRHHYLPLKKNRLYRWFLQDVAAVIAVSESVRRSIVERLELPEERVITIPNWVDPMRFKPLDREAARSLFRLQANQVVACIGQITPAKGQEEFIRAASRISHLRQDVEFVIAGEERETEQLFTKHLLELSNTLGISRRVHFLGHVHYVPELLAAIDVVVVPSWDEGFSLVTVEAMAARKPIIASRVGGITDIIKDGSNGALIPARDPKAMADKLMLMLMDSSLRMRLGEQAQRDAFTYFGRDNIIDRIEALYFEVLGINPQG